MMPFLWSWIESHNLHIFCGVQSTYTTSQVAEVLMKEIHRIHGIPKVLVGDKDPKFTGMFWK